MVASYRCREPGIGHRRGVPYARVWVHVAPLGLVKGRPFRLRIFASFCASCAILALFSLQFGFVSGAFWVRFARFWTALSFVFNDFLASFPLFFIFCSSRVSRLAGARRFWFAPRGRGGHGLRRIVADPSTYLGYHLSTVLSSEDGKKSSEENRAPAGAKWCSPGQNLSRCI